MQIHWIFVRFPQMPRIELMFSFAERPQILSMLRWIQTFEEALSQRDYLIWIGGSLQDFSGFSSMLFVYYYSCFYSILGLPTLGVYKTLALDFSFSGEKFSALRTAPRTPLLTRSLAEVSFDSFALGSSTSFAYSFVSFTSSFVSFFLRAASLSSSLLAMTLAQKWSWWTKPSPGWIQGLPFLTRSFASSKPSWQVLITQAMTKELLRETPAQQCTSTPPRFLPAAMS